MKTSFLKHTKKPFFPLWAGVTCAFLSVNKICIFLLIVASTISEKLVILQTVKIQFTNKALIVVANSQKPLKARCLPGFFYFTHLITCL